MDERKPQEVPTIDVPEAAAYPVLQNKVAIVTGAAMGMGKATATVRLCRPWLKYSNVSYPAIRQGRR